MDIEQSKKLIEQRDVEHLAAIAEAALAHMKVQAPQSIGEDSISPTMAREAAAIYITLRMVLEGELPSG